MAHERNEPSVPRQLSEPDLLAAMCDRLAELATSETMHAQYDAVVDRLIACGGGRTAARAKLQHLRRRLSYLQISFDPQASRDLALLDAAIGELADD